MVALLHLFAMSSEKVHNVTHTHTRNGSIQRTVLFCRRLHLINMTEQGEQWTETRERTVLTALKMKGEN